MHHLASVMMVYGIEEMFPLGEDAPTGIRHDGVWHLKDHMVGSLIGIRHDARPKFVKCVSTLPNDKNDMIH